jgi:hypothetical protein
MYTTSVERPTGSADIRRSHRDRRRCSGGQSPAIRGCLSDLRGPRTRSRLARGARDVWSRHKTHAQRSARRWPEPRNPHTYANQPTTLSEQIRRNFFLPKPPDVPVKNPFQAVWWRGATLLFFLPGTRLVRPTATRTNHFSGVSDAKKFFHESRSTTLTRTHTNQPPFLRWRGNPKKFPPFHDPSTTPPRHLRDPSDTSPTHGNQPTTLDPSNLSFLA